MRFAASSATCARSILRDSVAAVSAGIVDGEPLLDLDYPEDSPRRGRSQRRPAGPRRPGRGARDRRRGRLLRAQLQALLDLAEAGIDHLGRLQREAMGADWSWEQ